MMENLYLAYGLIALGLLLLAAELFIPTGGVLFVLAVSALIVGVAMTFVSNTYTGMVTLLGLCSLVRLVGTAVFNYWRNTAFGKRFFLTGPEEDETVTTMTVNLELEQLRGRYGRTVSALRPAGVTDFDGRRVDTLSEGAMVEPGQWVRCIDVKAGRVIVRQADKPPDLG